MQELLFSLGCAHTYHDECIGQYATVKGTTVGRVSCPICKYSPDNPVDVSDSDSGGPVDEGDVEGEGCGPAPEVEEDAEGEHLSLSHV